MKPSEPALDRLATANALLLDPYGLDEGHLHGVLSTIFEHRADYADLYFQYTRERGAAAVHRVESVRVQLAALRTTVADAEVAQAVRALEEKLVALEMELVDLRQTGQGQDGVRWEAKLLQKLGYLATGLGNADFRPTDQQVEVQGILNTQLQRHLTALESLLGSDLNALNALLRQKGVPNVVGGPAVVP